MADLGTRFELLSNTFKPYPCGIVIHAVIDACLALSSTRNLEPEMIKELIIEVPPVTIALADTPHPQSIYAAQVSVQHWAAAALLQGEAGIEQGSLQAIANPDIRTARSKCRLVSRPDLAADAAIVSLHTTDDCRREVKITHCTGSFNNPLGEDALSNKFMAQAAPILGKSDAAKLLDRCWALPTDDDARSIWRSSQ